MYIYNSIIFCLIFLDYPDHSDLIIKIHIISMHGRSQYFKLVIHVIHKKLNQIFFYVLFIGIVLVYATGYALTTKYLLLQRHLFR